MALEVRACNFCKVPRAHEVKKTEGGTAYSCKMCGTTFTETKEVHQK